MLTSIRGLVAASFATGLALSSAPAFAETTVSSAEFDLETRSDSSDVTINVTQLMPATEHVEENSENNVGSESDLTLSANVTLATQYRFRGVAMTGGDPAIQGGIDLVHSSGFYVGAWGSSLEGGAAYGELELNFYGGWSGEISDGISLDVGLLQYNYPTDGGLIDPTDVNSFMDDFNVNYWEPYASITTTFGPAEASFGIAYAWKQSSLGDQDNLWIYTDLGVGIPNTPISLNAHVGYTDGVLAPPLLAGADDDTGIDWSIGASASIFGGLELGVSYIGVEGPSVDDFTDDAFVATLSASF